MQFAIISDIHANLDALNAVLKYIGDDIPVVCLGDLVGYGAQPNEVVDSVKARAIHTVLGNHDLFCASGLGMNDMNPRAAAAASWTHKNLTQENKEWLLALPYLITEPTYAIVHGSPNQPELFYYVIGERAITNAFKAATRKVTFVGHSHHPDISELQPTGKVWNSIVAGNNVFNLHPWASYIVNVGSIGQPRDRDTRASFVVYDDERRTATWHRVAYNIAVAQAKIRATSLPPDCADRLGVGK